MELTNEFLYNQTGKQALTKLFEAPFPGPSVPNVWKLKYCLERQFKNLQKEFEGLLKKYAELKEDGSVDFKDEKGTFSIKKEALSDWNKEVSELMKKSFEIKGVDKIHVSQIANTADLKLSASEMEFLEPLIEGLDFDLDK